MDPQLNPRPAASPPPPASPVRTGNTMLRYEFAKGYLPSANPKFEELMNDMHS